jgi:hypothetical protein
MTDDLENVDARERTRIDVTDDWEVRFWCDHWNISPARLKQAIAKVGTSTEDVARELGKLS